MSAGLGPESLCRLTAGKAARPQNAEVLQDCGALHDGLFRRNDDFAAQVYLFCVRVLVLAKQPSSYQPAMLHLLRALHPRHLLTSVELREVAAYLVLDTACHRRQLAEAYALRLRYGLGDDAKLGAALAALAHDNPVLFRRAKRGVDGHRASIMDWAEPDMRHHALKCVAKSYLSVDVAFLERVTASTWHKLTRPRRRLGAGPRRRHRPQAQAVVTWAEG